MNVPPAPLKHILGSTFRANPLYELVLFDRLSEKEREVLAPLQLDPEFYGILRPGAGGLSSKGASREVALLFLSLQEPGTLPSYVARLSGDTCNSDIAALVLDGVLEIEAEGRFHFGSTAHRYIYSQAGAQDGRGTIGRLSVAALKYAQGLDCEDAGTLSYRLYNYNRLPVTPSTTRSLHPRQRVVDLLGIAPNGGSRLLGGRWVSTTPGTSNLAWQTWRLRGQRPPAAPASATAGATYKLYVSPQCVHLKEVFWVTAEVLAELECPSFKVGRDMLNVLRPDKIVAYFSTLGQVKEAATRLLSRLQGVQAHGVPFTAQIDEAGLVSWGIDPPHLEHLLPWQGPSWRRWVTDRLAVALLASRAGGATDLEPWQFATSRLQLEGIDTTTWTPTAGMWGIEEVIAR